MANGLINIISRHLSAGKPRQSAVRAIGVPAQIRRPPPGYKAVALPIDYNLLCLWIKKS